MCECECVDVQVVNGRSKGRRIWASPKTNSNPQSGINRPGARQTSSASKHRAVFRGNRSSIWLARTVLVAASAHTSIRLQQQVPCLPTRGCSRKRGTRGQEATKRGEVQVTHGSIWWFFWFRVRFCQKKSGQTRMAVEE